MVSSTSGCREGREVLVRVYEIGVVAREPNRSVWLLSMKRMIGRARTLVMPAVSATVVVVVVVVVVIVVVVVVVMLLCVLG